MMFNKKYRITTLEDEPERRTETIQLIEKAFGYSDLHQFAVDFFPLVGPNNAQNCHIVIDSESNKVVAHTAVLLRLLGNTHFKSSTAILGGISVDPTYQRQGIMSHLIRYIIKEYEEDIALFFLWSDLHSLYGKHHFFPTGGQIQLGNSPLDSSIDEHFEKKKFSQLEVSDWKDIQEIYQNETLKWHTSFIRGERDWQAIQAIESADLYIFRSPSGRIGGYFVANKGFDLSNIVHEIGYLPEYKAAILQKIEKYRVWLPEQEKLFFPHSTLQYMALMRIGSPEIFSHFIRNWSQGEIAIARIAGGIVNFRFQKEEYQENIQHFLSIVFGPSPVKEFEKFGPPLYLSGLDSV